MTQTGWLKTSFVAGALADTIFGVILLIPARMGETEITYPMGLAASLMFGWTVLLLWGYRRPIERKGLLLITIFPVIPGLLASAVYQMATGRLPFALVLPTAIVEIALIALLAFSYFNARTVNHSRRAN